MNWEINFLFNKIAMHINIEQLQHIWIEDKAIFTHLTRGWRLLILRFILRRRAIIILIIRVNETMLFHFLEDSPSSFADCMHNISIYSSKSRYVRQRLSGLRWAMHSTVYLAEFSFASIPISAPLLSYWILTILSLVCIDAPHVKIIFNLIAIVNALCKFSHFSYFFDGFNYYWV